MIGGSMPEAYAAGGTTPVSGVQLDRIDFNASAAVWRVGGGLLCTVEARAETPAAPARVVQIRRGRHAESVPAEGRGRNGKTKSPSPNRQLRPETAQVPGFVTER
jgi:hypothetical protein